MRFGHFPAFCLLLLIAVGCKSDATEKALTSANAFMQQVAAGKIAEAYRQTAFSYTARTPYQNFAHEAGKLKAEPAAGVAWAAPVKKDAQIELSGRVRQADGTSATVTLLMANEVTIWKVSAFRVSL